MGCASSTLLETTKQAAGVANGKPCTVLRSPNFRGIVRGDGSRSICNGQGTLVAGEENIAFVFCCSCCSSCCMGVGSDAEPLIIPIKSIESVQNQLQFNMAIRPQTIVIAWREPSGLVSQAGWSIRGSERERLVAHLRNRVSKSTTFTL